MNKFNIHSKKKKRRQRMMMIKLLTRKMMMITFLKGIKTCHIAPKTLNVFPILVMYRRNICGQDFLFSIYLLLKSL